MRYLGLDLGSRTLGMAVSDPSGIIATSIGTIRHNEEYERLVCEVEKIIKERNIDEIVLGLPKNMNNTIGERAQKCALFAEKLAELVDVPVKLWDERSTTVSAHYYLNQTNTRGKKRKAVVDAVAATIILESYLGFRKNTN